MEMGMESNEASNKNAQTPKWEWGDGGGIMGRLFLSSFKSSNSSSASSSVPVSSFLLYGTTTDTLYTHGTVQYLSALDYQAQRLHAVTNDGRGR